jgi:AraC-like DNA-binding protein
VDHGKPVFFRTIMTWIPEQNAVWAKYVYDDLRKRRLDAEAAIKASGIRRTTLSRKETMIPLEKHYALFGHAAEATGDECYGLNTGIDVDPKKAGLMGYIGLSSASLQDAFENFQRYTRIMSNAFTLILSLEDEVGIVERRSLATTMSFGHEQAREFSMAMLLRACRVFTGREIVPVAVEFVHRRTRNVAAFKHFFSCPISFGNTRETMVFRREHLLLPIVSADDKLLEVLKGYGDAVLEKRSESGPDFQNQVERWIIELLPKGEATAKIIAMELGMSERTFTRRLSDLGLTFKEILAEVRRDMALKYLANMDISLKQIAFLLGYSDASAFTHAFKRWTGETPADVRVAAIGS